MTEAVAAEALRVEQQSYLVRVFWLFGAGLAVSALTAIAGGTTADGVAFFESGGIKVLAVLIAPLGILFGLYGALAKLSVPVAYGIYFLFCAVDGFGLGVIFLVYTTASIALTFGVAAAMFGGMAVYGYATKQDLSGLGSLCLMGLWGVIVASVVNIFWTSSGAYWGTTIVGVLVFLGLTAYDMQKIKAANVPGDAGTDADKREAIMGAIDLYLDFINLLLKLLSILGKRK